MSDLKLGYIGLGNQGAPMAKRLAEWPGGLVVFDVRAEAMTPLAELGATLADSVADVADADVISVTVLTDAQVRDVVGELAAHAKPGTVIAIHSTISPETAARIAAQLRPKGIHVVDAPVSGGAGAADKGELAVMVGATDEAYDTGQAGIQAVGFDGGPRRGAGSGHPDEAGQKHVDLHRLRGRVRGAEVGRGQRVSNLQKLGRVVRHSDAQQRRSGRDHGSATTPRPLAPDHFLYDMFVHTRVLAEKDLRPGVSDWARRIDVELPLAEIALR